VIGKTLNHSNQNTTQVYARLGEDPVRKALDGHGQRLKAVAKQGEPGEVIDFESKVKTNGK